MKILKVRHVTGARSREDRRVVAEQVVSFYRVIPLVVGDGPHSAVVRIYTSDGNHVDVASSLEQVEEALTGTWDGRPL